MDLEFNIFIPVLYKKKPLAQVSLTFYYTISTSTVFNAIPLVLRFPLHHPDPSATESSYEDPQNDG